MALIKHIDKFPIRAELYKRPIYMLEAFFQGQTWSRHFYNLVLAVCVEGLCTFWYKDKKAHCSGNSCRHHVFVCRPGVCIFSVCYCLLDGFTSWEPAVSAFLPLASPQWLLTAMSIPMCQVIYLCRWFVERDEVEKRTVTHVKNTEEKGGWR